MMRQAFFGSGAGIPPGNGEDAGLNGAIPLREAQILPGRRDRRVFAETRH